MALSEPLPDLEEVLASIGQAGRRLAEMHASEGAAGNISVFIGFPLEVRRRFPLAEPLPLPQPAPALAGKLVIVTGSGRRLRDVRDNPAANLGCVLIDKSGEHGTLYTAPERLFARVTSEFNSHLAVHNDLVARTGTNFHAVVHAQPLHITYLSHMAAIPTALNDLSVQGTKPAYDPINKSGWNGPYVDIRVADWDFDAWGRSYQYTSATRTIRSCGPNGTCGDADDISITF